MNKMNPEVKTRWVAALRSGEYKQGKNKLNVGGAMCCLGVLCDLHAKECGAQWEQDGPLTAFYFGAPHYLPDPVINWAGLSRTGANVEINGIADVLPNHNDNGRTFAEIADAIEAQL